MSRKRRPKPPKPVFLIDNREQCPWSFAGLPSWTGEPIAPDQVEWGTLKTADYSVKGFESKIGLERKSVDDLFGTLSFGRDRFAREVERAKDLDFFAVIVEGSLDQLSQGHSRLTRFTGSACVRTVLSWSIRFPWVRWFFGGNRDGARLIGLRLLERFYALEMEKQFTAGGGDPQTGEVPPGGPDDLVSQAPGQGDGEDFWGQIAQEVAGIQAACGSEDAPSGPLKPEPEEKWTQAQAH